MGKKAMTAIMVINLIHEILMIIGKLLSSAAMVKVLGNYNLTMLLLVVGSNIFGIIISAVIIFLTVPAIGYILHEERNTVLMGAIWLSMLANFVRALFLSLQALSVLRTTAGINAALSAGGQLNLSLFLICGYGVMRLTIALLMLVMIIKMPKTEER